MSNIMQIFAGRFGVRLTPCTCNRALKSSKGKLLPGSSLPESCWVGIVAERRVWGRTSWRRRTPWKCSASPDDDDDDGDDDDEWLYDVEAQQVDPYDDDGQEVPFHDELGDDDLVQYSNVQERTRLEAQNLTPPQYDPDPRMRIMTKDGSRFDEDGVDRLKFAWEKMSYEIPEIHQTPEMLELRREAEESARLKSGERPPKPHDIDKWMDKYAPKWADLMGADAWDILEDYFPSEAEAAREEQREARLKLLQSEGLDPERREQLEAREYAVFLQFDV